MSLGSTDSVSDLQFSYVSCIEISLSDFMLAGIVIKKSFPRTDTTLFHILVLVLFVNVSRLGFAIVIIESSSYSPVHNVRSYCSAI